jgi:cell fate regulator YaaT (PSP1 superfamily)
MENNSQALVVAIRFSKVGKLYHFDARNLGDIKVGDWVTVETSRGWQLGEIAQIIGYINESSEGNWKLIDRRATEADLEQKRKQEILEQELVEFSRKTVTARKLEGVKIVSCEYSLDGTRLTVLYSFEGENKIDLRFLRNDISQEAGISQIELRQIGPRDVAKIFGGMGACGLPTRCCSKFLTDFSSISIRMAKTQGISLTPAEITGMCGRLRCCLIYEYELYAENRKLLPKRNKRVMTPVGEGKVIDVLPLKMGVVVLIPELGRKEFNNSDIQLLDAHGVPIGSPVKNDNTEIDLFIEDEVDSIESNANPDEKIENQDKSQKTSSDRKNTIDNNRNRRPRRRKRRSNYQGRDEQNSGNKD